MSGEQSKLFYLLRLLNGGLNFPQSRPETPAQRPEMGMVLLPDQEIAICAA